jgi:hypothetical protein
VQSKYEYIEGFSARIEGFENGLIVNIENGMGGLIDKIGTEIFCD